MIEVARSDFDVVAERLVPYAVRGETREKLNQLTEEFRQKLLNLESLTNGGRLGCPICMSAEHVVITGNGRGGAKKFECRAWHDPAMIGRDDHRFRFSTYTSHEALKVYEDFLVEALTLLTFCDGTYEGVAKYLNVSRHMVEFSTAVLLDYLGKEGKRESIPTEGNMVVVYADFSTTRVSRAANVVMSRVGDSIAYQVCCSVNYMSAWNFVRALKERLVLKPGATVVWVTDGESAWVDPIRAFFPEAVHIRQFHSESSLGLVYVHLPFGGKLYTVRCIWNAVLEKGEAGEKVLKMRKRRKLESGKKSSDKTELFDGVILWEGAVYEPRGMRRKRDATVSGATSQVEDHIVDAHAGNGPSRAPEAEMRGFETLGKARHHGDGDIAPRTDGAKRVFKGSLEDAVRIPVVKHAYSILVRVFGGLYITSNAVECLFSVKSALRYHRTVKNGNALILVLLYLKTRLRKKSRTEIKSFFRRDVVTLERIRRVAVGTSVGQTWDKKERAKRVVLDAYRESRPLVIHYRSAKGRRTSRMIEPLEIEKDPYTGMLKVRAYCYLRNAKRTFLLDRIADAIPMNTDLSIVA
jgi:hypothetical protein